jgi:hypothetical protein
MRWIKLVDDSNWVPDRDVAGRFVPFVLHELNRSPRSPAIDAALQHDVDVAGVPFTVSPTFGECQQISI